MKFSISGMAGITLLVGFAFMSAAIAAERSNGERRPAFEGSRSAQGSDVAAGRRGARRGPTPERQLERMDANDDEQVSENEFIEFRLSRVDEQFERRDRDDDGLISHEENPRSERRASRSELDRTEVIACVRETIPGFAPNADMDREQRFEATDTNGDGSLTLAELSAALEAQAHEAFTRIDTDEDGFITTEEFKARRQVQFQTRRAVNECVKKVIQA
jgi:Ca2+-binding EF-hand superfamily protein